MIKNGVLEVLKAVAVAIISSLLLVLLFAFVLKQFSLPSSVIKPVNSVIKIAVIFLGSIFCLKPPKGFLKGLILGLLATLFQHLIYSFFGGGFKFDLTMLLDVVLGMVAGLICGVICSNKK